jgi:hypothetical protein
MKSMQCQARPDHRHLATGRSRYARSRAIQRARRTQCQLVQMVRRAERLGYTVDDGNEAAES